VRAGTPYRQHAFIIAGSAAPKALVTQAIRDADLFLLRTQIGKSEGQAASQ
jgi:hypothetical protein